MAIPVLYGLARSVYTRIALLALEEKQVEYALEQVEIFGPDGVPPAHLERHPFGRIPVFEHDGFTLYETGAITRYIDEAFPGRSLQPSAPRARARMNQIIGLLDAYAYRPMIWDVFVQRVPVPKAGGVADEAIVAGALPKVRVCLDALERLLGSERYFTGDEISLADLHAAPMFLYFTQTAEGSQMLSAHPSIARWLSDFRHRRSVERTKSIYG